MQGHDILLALVYPGGEVALNALDGGRLRCLQEPGTELLTIGAVVDPLARRSDPFPDRDHGGVGRTRLTGRNVGSSPRAGNRTAETGLPGWGGRIRTFAWRNRSPLL